LEAVADEPFERTDAVRDKRHRLDTLTAALQTSADSPEAKAKETEHQQRMDAQGREPGWSLALNPTPALRAEFGDAELARRAGHGGGDSDTRGLVGAGVGAGPAWATQRQQARGPQPAGPRQRLSAAQLAGMFDPGPITNLGPRPSSRTQGEHERDRDRNDKDYGR